MGIYSNGVIFGIRMYDFNDEGFSNILFEQVYVDKINREQMIESYLVYEELSNKNKNKIFFNILTECMTTHELNNKKKYMDWYPISPEQFLKTFKI
jgi:hypothetical protein